MSYYDIPERPLDPPEPTLRKVYTCAICDEPIYEGQDYFEIPGLGPCCEGCISECRRYEAELEYPESDRYREED